MKRLFTVLFGVLISLAMVSHANADGRDRRRDGRDYRYGYSGRGYYQPRGYYPPPQYYYAPPAYYYPRPRIGIQYYYDPYRGTFYYRW